MFRRRNPLCGRDRIDFVICGVQKGGTTALDAYLREHPGIAMAREKELHFFDDESLCGEGRPDLDRYHAHFEVEESHAAVGEATPSYMFWRPSAQRLWEYSPDLKLIAILRDPISRAFSHWNMQIDRGIEPLDFGTAIRTEVERCRVALPDQHKKFSYVRRGHYLEQFRRLWDFFPRDQLLVLFNDDLRKAPDETLKRATNFLGLDPLPPVTEREVHARPYAQAMSDEDRDHLRAEFEPDIRGLERELGVDLDHWLNDVEDA